MKFTPLDVFRIKKKLREKKEEQVKVQEYRIIKTKQYHFDKDSNFFHTITYDINPFIYVSRSYKEVKYIEDICVNVKDLFENQYEIALILKNPYLKLKEKRQIIDDLIKRWEYDYYQDVDEQLTITLERASFIPIKHITRIKNWTIHLYIMLTIVFLFFLRQFSSLQLIPFIGNAFKYINTLLIYERYYTTTVGVVYLSIIIAMYLLIVKVYFDKVLKFGLSAKGFLIKERDRMLKKLNPHKKKIQKHLYKFAKRREPIEPFVISQIYNSKVVVQRIKRYGRTVITRIGIFTTYYNQIILVSKLLRLIHLSIIVYLLYSLLKVNRLI